ncbi:hypothetical protein TSMEX_001216 [Taenia solium]|eukprot:TsM_000198800 transcript=TsM_000198800 gene=TsM_000198800
MTTRACQSEIQRLHRIFNPKRGANVKPIQKGAVKAPKRRVVFSKDALKEDSNSNLLVNQPCANVFCAPVWQPCHLDCDCCEGFRCEKVFLPSLCAPPAETVDG